jgi:hypothetical protein
MKGNYDGQVLSSSQDMRRVCYAIYAMLASEKKPVLGAGKGCNNQH